KNRVLHRVNFLFLKVNILWFVQCNINYSSKFHFGLRIKYKITIPINPNKAVKIDNPIETFIINIITALVQKAKKAHFFHLNRNIAKITLANSRAP
ncbi:MAG: hypothetical protein COW21_01755, partial [Candidatus Aenigmarchaeota archaeon CG15_BIG_FIL_POST_REV_8_21_14_020_37_27]